MSFIEFHFESGVAVIILNRSAKLNAFNREMGTLLQERLDECAASHEIRSVYITGAGKGFSAGQDLAEVTDPQSPALATMISEMYNPIIRKIRNLNKPVLAAVNGIAAGAGANIALGCDITVAARSASFIQAFSKIGLIPDSGGTYFLPRLVGWQKASALAMLGDRITAMEAERMGMIYKVFEDDVFQEASLEIAHELARMPTTALALTKHALNYAAVNSLEEQLILEGELQAKAVMTADYKEGIQSFFQKRQPLFKGK